ncbi:MAG: hypothetical protein J0M35_20385 [Candidatus Obscuribacter phosphatis]|uniref:Uncharacterized protein n=1 Tax=Candidatus Obscuribacter phosphatis TaxID=1906157 RepID=A0A8J7PIL9_9BACT|nr:hypothetical protein [Candidatus Obscuribacter phosphatis]
MTDEKRKSDQEDVATGTASGYQYNFDTSLPLDYEFGLPDWFKQTESKSDFEKDTIESVLAVAEVEHQRSEPYWIEKNSLSDRDIRTSPRQRELIALRLIEDSRFSSIVISYDTMAALELESSLSRVFSLVDLDFNSLVDLDEMNKVLKLEDLSASEKDLVRSVLQVTETVFNERLVQGLVSKDALAALSFEDFRLALYSTRRDHADHGTRPSESSAAINHRDLSALDNSASSPISPVSLDIAAIPNTAQPVPPEARTQEPPQALSQSLSQSQLQGPAGAHTKEPPEAPPSQLQAPPHTPPPSYFKTPSPKRLLYANLDLPLTSINADAVKLSPVGDSYFAAAVCSLARLNPRAILRMIRINLDGSYSICFPGSRRPPFDVMPPRPEELNCYGMTDKFGFWYPLLEKAYGIYVAKISPLNSVLSTAGSGKPRSLVARRACQAIETLAMSSSSYLVVADFEPAALFEKLLTLNSENLVVLAVTHDDTGKGPPPRPYPVLSVQPHRGIVEINSIYEQVAGLDLELTAEAFAKAFRLLFFEAPQSGKAESPNAKQTQNSQNSNTGGVHTNPWRKF